MKRGKIITIGLCVILAVTVVRTAGSFASVKERLELKGANQWTMQVAKSGSEVEEDSEAEPTTVTAPEKAETVGEQAPSEETETEETETGEPEAEIPSEEETPETNENPEAPVLTLESDTITIGVGESFNVISVVDEITDDKDDSNELFRHIRIGGEYDVNTPGEYTLEYIVTDLDGNDSASRILTLIVEE